MNNDIHQCPNWLALVPSQHFSWCLTTTSGRSWPSGGSGQQIWPSSTLWLWLLSRWIAAVWRVDKRSSLPVMGSIRAGTGDLPWLVPTFHSKQSSHLATLTTLLLCWYLCVDNTVTLDHIFWTGSVIQLWLKSIKQQVSYHTVTILMLHKQKYFI